MSKVRINDLARELEVKSKSILDALTAVGVTAVKTHSSSIEFDEADKVREYINRGTRPAAAAKPAKPEPPRFDLSGVSKPGDALKAILARKAAESAAHSAPPTVVRPASAPPAAVVAKPAAAAPPAAKPAAPAPPPPPAFKRVVPQPRQPANIIAPAPPPPPPAIASRPMASTVVVAKAPVVVAKPAAAAPEPTPAAPVAPPPAPEVEAAAPAPPAPPAPPARRMIMPQTGPRPSYTAAPGAAAALASAGPQRGRPIFERPRPGMPGSPGARPGFGPATGPSARRPMHPTRTYPAGTGPAGGPGAPGFRPGGPGRPGFGAPRPGGPPGAGGMMLPPGEAPRPARPGQRRGGQRYEKTKEGPMKGFQPPPRYGGAMINSEPLPITRTITVTEGISVKDLAEKLEVRGKDLIATLLMRGVFVTVNQSLDGELARDVARQFGADTVVLSVEEQLENEAIEGLLEDTSGLVEITRSPVVTVMGHVDHGKTSLLDAIRSTDVAAGEAGGITQHIGAYKVRITKPDSPAFGREIVFLDTPGHEAFTRMRARGAKVTDIVVIVVAADDGVMPQTLEAIDHARAANVPIIVAVNKIDKPEAQPDRVKQQLADRGLQPEAWGGTTVFVDVSAKKRQNLDLLEEMICLVADVAALKATPDRAAVGTVLEAKLDRGRGAVASVLVQNGTLKTGDTYIVGNTYGKIRAMFNDRGQPITEAGPSTPVEILGLEGMPDAGDTFLVMADRDKAKGIAQYRKMKEREAQLAKSSRVSLEGLAEQIKQAGVKDLNIILKGDVQGSVEVLADSMQRMSTEKVRVRVLHSGVGAITESDILLASASNAVVIGFNVRPERKAQEIADQEHVQIRLHSIIYELQDEMTKAMYGLLDPVFKENYLGRAEVLNVFKVSKVGTIAGCRVTDGLIKRDSQVRVMREGVEVYKGKIASLKRFKDDASEVRVGVECGIDLGNFKDVAVGDLIEAFSTEKMAAELGANSAVTAAAVKAAAAAEAAATAAAEAAEAKATEV
jgi:translation initiation factor IF-2